MNVSESVFCGMEFDIYIYKYILKIRIKWYDHGSIEK